MASPALPQTEPALTHQPRNPWKPIAIALALLLAVAVIALALVATGVMQLGLSLL